MRDIPIYTVDAFTDRLFSGNTCAVCVFPDWPDDGLLQSIAKQNLFAETAFIVPHAQKNPELRWFTLSQEVDFCGYGTLSAGQVYLTHLAKNQSSVTFTTRNYGDIPVKNNNGIYEITVPAKPPLQEIFNDAVFAALGGPRPQSMMTTTRDDLLIVYDSQDEVRAVKPAFAALMANGYYGYVLTAPGHAADFAYRYFSPRMTDVWEDPVNGASQSVLTPYWSTRLGKAAISGEAVSNRGGHVYCQFDGKSQVTIGGKVTPYLQGNLTI